MSEAARTLELRFPAIPWREPIQIMSMIDGSIHFGCRLCIAINGLKGRDVLGLPTDPNEIRRHLESHHA